MLFVYALLGVPHSKQSSDFSHLNGQVAATWINSGRKIKTTFESRKKTGRKHRQDKQIDRWIGYQAIQGPVSRRIR